MFSPAATVTLVDDSETAESVHFGEVLSPHAVNTPRARDRRSNVAARRSWVAKDMVTRRYVNASEARGRNEERWSGAKIVG